MPDSDTSSEINVNLYDNNGKIDNKEENLQNVIKKYISTPSFATHMHDHTWLCLLEHFIIAHPSPSAR